MVRNPRITWIEVMEAIWILCRRHFRDSNLQTEIRQIQSLRLEGNADFVVCNTALQPAMIWIPTSFVLSNIPSVLHSTSKYTRCNTIKQMIDTSRTHKWRLKSRMQVTKLQWKGGGKSDGGRLSQVSCHRFMCRLSSAGLLILKSTKSLWFCQVRLLWYFLYH